MRKSRWTSDGNFILVLGDVARRRGTLPTRSLARLACVVVLFAGVPQLSLALWVGESARAKP